MVKKVVMDGDLSVQGVSINANMQQKTVSVGIAVISPTGSNLGSIQIAASNNETPESENNEVIPAFDELLATPEGQALYAASDAFMVLLSGYSKMLKTEDVAE